MIDWVTGLIRQSQYRRLFALALMLMTFNLMTSAHASPSSGNPARQSDPVWCFSRLEDRKHEIVYHLVHQEGTNPEAILDAYAMPASWWESLSNPFCLKDWDQGAQYLQAVLNLWVPSGHDNASFTRDMLKLYGTPVIGSPDRPPLPPTDRMLQIDEVWCYTFFQKDGSDEGFFLGHYPGLESERILARYAATLDRTGTWQDRGAQCFPSWRLAYSFTQYLTKTKNIGNFLATDDRIRAAGVISIYGTPWPASNLLAPSRVSALLEPDAKPRWCFTIFTGGEGSTGAFGHYPDMTVEEVLKFYKPPAWVKDLAAQQETSCYSSWEAAFRSRPLEWKQFMLLDLPARPGEADYEIVLLKGSFSTKWQEYRRPEFSAAGAADPLTLTRIAPTPTITPTPTWTPIPDPRVVSRDAAVWCFTHVEDLSHEVVFYMGHAPGMSNSDIRQAYHLPPGLLSQPDRETFCYENWREAALFARTYMIDPYSMDGVQILSYPPENSNEDQLREYQTAIEQAFGTLITGDIEMGNNRYTAKYDKPDQPVWCYSYFTEGTPNFGIYLGHYVGEGDEAIVADYEGNPLSGKWTRVPDSTQCFMTWKEAASFHDGWTGETVDYKGKAWDAYEKNYARILISTRAVIQFQGPQIQGVAPTVTPAMLAAATATRLPSRTALLDPAVTHAVWCYTIFTGGGGSTATFGHYPGMTTEEVVTLFNAPAWVKDLAAQQETNCYASWAAAFEGISPPALRKTLAPYLPDAPAEADYETAMLWLYFKTKWRDYQRSELSAEGTPQPMTLTRIAPTPMLTPTPIHNPDEQVWCFSLYYDDTVSVFDVLIGYYPGMDDTAIAAMHQLDEGFLSARPNRKTACFYSYTDAARFQNAVFEGEYLLPVRTNQNETNNQSQLKQRYITGNYDIVSDDYLERAKAIFDEAPFTQPRNQGTPAPTPAADAPLLDTDNAMVWCATYYRNGNQLVVLGHYPGMSAEEVLEIYKATDAMQDHTQEKRVCYTSWKEAANTEYFRVDYLDAPKYNEADYEILVLQYFFTGLWKTYQQPEFSAKVTPQIMQTPAAVTPAAPNPPSPATLLVGDELPRWCQTTHIHPGGLKMTFGHYPDLDVVKVLLAIGAEKIESTDCYATWRAAAETLPESERARLELPDDPTEADYETALLKYHFGISWKTLQRKEFSAGVLLNGFTAANAGKLVWCSYTVATASGLTGNLDDYPNKTVEEILTASPAYKNWLEAQPLLRSIACYGSWREAMKSLYPDGLKVHQKNLPDTLSEGDYEVLFLWFRFNNDWKKQQRPEFSADEPPSPAVIQYVEKFSG